MRCPGGTVRRSEHGLSLVELIAAMFILSIVFSAVAASLISFVRSASTSERRVQATALLNELHEEFQSLPFESAGNLDSEVADLVPVGATVTPGSPGPPSFVFDGRDGVVLFEECDEGDSTCQRRIPRAYQLIESPDVSGLETYEVFQIVTWIDRSGDGIGDTKRLTTIVRWEWLGRPFEEAFESERAPTVSEAGNPASARAFLTAPPFVQLQDPDEGFVTNTIATPIPLIANFTVPVADDSVEVVIQQLNAAGDGLVEDLVTLTPDLSVTSEGVGSVRFSGSIGVNDVAGVARRFPVGVVQFRVEGSAVDGGTTLTGVSDVRFVGVGITTSDIDGTVDDGPDEDNGVIDADPVLITSATAAPTTVRFRSTFNCSLTISAVVSGLTDNADGFAAGEEVIASYTDTSGAQRTRELHPGGDVNGPVISSGTTFSTTLGTANNHGFTHDKDRSLRFEIVASRPGGQSADSAISETNLVTFRNNSGNC